MAKKFLSLLSNGHIKNIESVNISSGSSDTEKIVSLDDLGQIHDSMLSDYMKKSVYDVDNDGIIDKADIIDILGSIEWSKINNKPTNTISLIDVAVSNKHEHSNKTILDGTTASFTTELFTKYEGYINGKQNIYENGFIPENIANKGTSNGYASLDGSTPNAKILIFNIPANKLKYENIDMVDSEGNPISLDLLDHDLTGNLHTDKITLSTLNSFVSDSTIPSNTLGTTLNKGLVQLATSDEVKSSTGGNKLITPNNLYSTYPKKIYIPRFIRNFGVTTVPLNKTTFFIDCGNGIILGCLYHESDSDHKVIYKSTDYGETWDNGQYLNDNENLKTSRIYCGVRLSNNDILVSTGMGVNSRIYKSFDNGSTWSTIKIEPLNDNIDVMGLGIYKDSDNKQFILAFARDVSENKGYIYKSTDNGETWSNKNYIENATYLYKGCQLSNGHIITGAYPTGQIFRSTDYGLNWSSATDTIKLPILPDTNYIFDFLLLDDKILAATHSKISSIFQSIDGGYTWSPIDSTNFKYVADGVYFGTRRFLKLSNNYIFAALLTNKTIISKDNGNTWSNLNESININGNAMIELTNKDILFGTETYGYRGTSFYKLIEVSIPY